MKADAEHGGPEWMTHGVWGHTGFGDNKMLGLRWSAGVSVSFFQMVQNLSNDLVLGDEGDDAELASALTLQRVGLIYTADKLCPAFPQSGAPGWRELGFFFGCGVLLAGEGLKDEVGFVAVSPRSGGVGAKISHIMFSRLGDLGEDSRQKLEQVEGLALRRGVEGVVGGAFGFIEQRFGARAPVKARQAQRTAK